MSRKLHPGINCELCMEPIHYIGWGNLNHVCNPCKGEIDKLKLRDRSRKKMENKITDIHNILRKIDKRLENLEQMIGYAPGSDNYELIKEHFENLQGF